LKQTIKLQSGDDLVNCSFSHLERTVLQQRKGLKSNQNYHTYKNAS